MGGEPRQPARRLEAVVRGRVQGVGYRMFVYDRATALGLVGWVANEPDGSVRTVAQGREPELVALLRDLHAGPRGARVEAVDERWLPPADDLDRFSIRSAWHAGD